MPLLESWVDSANQADSHFPLNNLPYGAFSNGDTNAGVRCGTAIGDQLLDLAALEAAGLIDASGDSTTPTVFDQPGINAFMALGADAWDRVRARLTELLRRDGDGDNALRNNPTLRGKALLPLSEVTLHMPFTVSEYTDFYACRQHAENVGTMFRGKDNALPPNWLHIPIGYNGRASTVVVSGSEIRRPLGQTKAPDAERPSFGPCRRLDIELEMGAVVGTPNTMGEPITVAAADAMIFGYVLLNDWSARDIQAWEYQPLGPFQAKVFATSISPWVVTKAALQSFRVATPAREHELLPYLHEDKPLLYDIELAVSMQSPSAPQAEVIARTNYRNMYYSAAQQLAHHAIGGCKMNTGDLLGSGTISGDNKDAFGSLLEITWGGQQPLSLADGETRTFIEDGDTLTLSGYAQGSGFRIGFGECSGTILPAPDFP